MRYWGFVLALNVFLFSTQPRAWAGATPIGSPLVCKGPLILSFDPDDYVMRFPFYRGTVPAGVGFQKMAEGTCAWLDRPVDNTEPSLVAIAQIPSKEGSLQAAQYGAMAAGLVSASLVPGTLFYLRTVLSEASHAPPQLLSVSTISILPPGTNQLPPGFYYK